MGFFRDKIVVVTGGGSGIGLSLCKAFDREGAIAIVCDINIQLANHVASKLLTHPQRLLSGFGVDVTDTKQVKEMIRFIVDKYGRIDIYCSNAGIIHPPVGVSPAVSPADLLTLHSNQEWNRIFQVNTLSHIIAVRELLPHWLDNTKITSSSSCSKTHQNDTPVFVMTASAAGLLTQIGNASYGVSKAAAVSFAEHLAIEHGDRVRVLCLCQLTLPLVIIC